jgi:hypothetical protein
MKHLGKITEMRKKYKNNNLYRYYMYSHTEAIKRANETSPSKKNKEVIDNDYYKSPIKENEAQQENDKAKDNAQQGQSDIEIQGNKITKENDINYGRNTGLYSKTLLNKQLRQHFITIPHSTQPFNELFENLKSVSKNIKYLCVAQEKHTEGGEHYHILLTSNSGIRIEQIHKRIMMTEGNIRGSINYQYVKTIQAVETYIKKDGKYKEYGNIATQQYNKDTKDKINEDLNEIYTSGS